MIAGVLLHVIHQNRDISLEMLLISKSGFEPIRTGGKLKKPTESAGK